MSDYTPTTEQILNQWVAEWAPSPNLEAQFYRWLTAHDAEKRAEWEAEVAERVEWGCLFPGGAIVKCEDQRDAETERTYVLDMFPEAVVVRRNVRGPGDWLPVPGSTVRESDSSVRDSDSEESEDEK